MGSFSTIFEAMEQSSFIPAPPIVRQDFGRDKLGKIDAPNRIVWVPPETETINPGAGRAKANGNPRVIYRRSVPWEAHFWALANFGGDVQSHNGTGYVMPTFAAGFNRQRTLIVRVDASGERGSAHFSYSLDGAAFIPVGPVTSIEIPSAGLTVSIADGYEAPSFVAGDLYEFQGPPRDVDHYDAAEVLLVQILQAVRNQQWDGYTARPLTCQWRDTGQLTKHGRAGVLAIEFDIAVPDAMARQVTPSGMTIGREMFNPLTDEAIPNV